MYFFPSSYFSNGRGDCKSQTVAWYNTHRSNTERTRRPFLQYPQSGQCRVARIASGSLVEG